jgi:hypothetical protein
MQSQAREFQTTLFVVFLSKFTKSVFKGGEYVPPSASSSYQFFERDSNIQFIAALSCDGLPQTAMKAEGY